MSSRLRGRGRGWIWLVYWVVWGLLRLLYLELSHELGPRSATGNLPLVWWLLVLLYFVVDVSFLLLTRSVARRLIPADLPVRESFWHEASEIVPIWVLFHVVLLFLEYPVSARLENAGLGVLQVIVVAGFMIAGAAYLFRLVETDKKARTTDQGTKRGWGSTAIICFVGVMLLMGVLLAIPYLATRPLSPDSLIHLAHPR